MFMRWQEHYSVHLRTMPSSDSPSVRVPRSLPRGRSHLPREVVLVSQRERLIEAIVAVVGQRGYAAATVADVIRAARVSRTTFYEQFTDKEDAFLAAYEQRTSRHLGRVVRATAQQPAMACLQLGVRAWLDALAEDPAYARVAVVEVAAAGERAATARAAVLRRYAHLLSTWHGRVRAEQPTVPAVPEELFAAAVGGSVDLVAARIRAGGVEGLQSLAPVLVTLVLNVGAVPAGRDLAAALVAARSRRA